MEIGHVVKLRRTFSQQDFDQFAALSGDNNPIHVDPQFAAQTRFGKTVSHGMLLYATINSALSKYFPGTRQIEQELMFPNPTYVGEEIDVQLEVLETWPDACLARLKTVITKATGETVCDGQMMVQWTGEAGK